jgi:RNA polymerase primary sigma factor
MARIESSNRGSENSRETTGRMSAGEIIDLLNARQKSRRQTLEQLTRERQTDAEILAKLMEEIPDQPEAASKLKLAFINNEPLPDFPDSGDIFVSGINFKVPKINDGDLLEQLDNLHRRIMAGLQKNQNESREMPGLPDNLTVQSLFSTPLLWEVKNGFRVIPASLVRAILERTDGKPINEHLYSTFAADRKKWILKKWKIEPRTAKNKEVSQWWDRDFVQAFLSSLIQPDSDKTGRLKYRIRPDLTPEELIGIKTGLTEFRFEDNSELIDLPGFSSVTDIDSDDLIETYLSELSKVPQLEAEIQLELARSVAEGRAAFERYYFRGSRIREDIKKELWGVIQKGRQDRVHLIRSNLALAVSRAKIFAGIFSGNRKIDDIIQDANLGLLEGEKRFDYRRGCNFSTYVTWWIDQSIRREYEQNAFLIRKPAVFAVQLRAFTGIYDEIYAKNAGNPSVADLAELLEISESKIELFIRYLQTPVSLDQLIDKLDALDGAEMIEMITDPQAETAIDGIDRAYLEQLTELFRDWPVTEAYIVYLRFLTEEKWTQEQVGDLLGFSKEWVSRVEKKARSLLQENSDLLKY